MYGCDSWTIKKAECQRIDAFELCCWRRPLRVPWTARRSNQLTLKEISPEYSLGRLMLKLKLQYFGHLMQRTDSLEKILMLGKWGQEKKGMTEDEMVGWYHWLNGHEFVETPGDGEGQGSLACCSPWGHKESDTSKRLNNNWDRIHIPQNLLTVSDNHTIRTFLSPPKKKSDFSFTSNPSPRSLLIYFLPL